MSTDQGNGGGQASEGAHVDLAHLPAGYVVGGKYVIKRLLGEGANGSVYEGEHSEIGHRVAIKVVHKALAAREDIIARFRREARICGTIRNRHVGQVYDVGELVEGAPYMVMELHEGHSLGRELAASGPQPIADAVDVVSQLLVGLQAVHDSGAIHRDVKPDNVMLARESSGQSVVKLVDFGIGKSMTGDIRARNVTQEGMVVGSPDYMPPEQLRGDTVDHRVDIYAAGVVLYELITGRMPFNAQSLTELFVAILRDPIVPVVKQRSDCPPELEAIIMRAMAREANARYQSANEMRQALVGLQRSQRLSAGTLLRSRLSERPPGAAQSQTRRATTDTAYVHETERMRTAELRVPINRAGSRMLLVGALVAIGGVLAVWALRSSHAGPEESQAAASVVVPHPVVPAAAVAAPAAAPAAVPAPAAPAAQPPAIEPSAPAAEQARPASVSDTAPALRGGASSDTAPALRGGASSDTAPALRGGASFAATPVPEGVATPARDEATHAEPHAKKAAPIAKAPGHTAVPAQPAISAQPPAPAPAPVASAPAPASNAQPLADLVRSAAAAFVRGQMPLARSLYRDATERAPSSPDAWRGLGMVSSRMGERSEAARAFKRYLALRPDAADADAIRKKLEEQ